MNKLFFTFISFFSFFTICKGQSNRDVKNNALSIELGKVGFIFNATFDHQFKKKKYGYKLGIGSNFLKYQQVFQAGGGLYYLKGSKNNYAEIGLDLSYFNYSLISNDQKSFSLLLIDKPIKTIYSNLNIGYRFSGDKNIFRIGISPGLMNTGFLLGGYISYGVRL